MLIAIISQADAITLMGNSDSLEEPALGNLWQKPISHGNLGAICRQTVRVLLDFYIPPKT